ncbi:MAG: D-alanyl-D-alaninecarboxypeptidase/D-alanyl-D-al anine-endopeptidase [Myxococcales bacterium]|nr:D-alanyl-D-alaninecarboxypeptidase/D-alanyl-D-al anine-endopeptidase [Myxococcales bacterium]
MLALSIDTPRAHSQGSGSGTASPQVGASSPRSISGPQGGASPPLSMSAGSAAGSDDTDEEDATAGSAKALVAPKGGKERGDWLRDHLAAAIKGKPTLAKAKIGVVVTDLATGTELYAHDADQGMNLASTTKLLTTVAALATLGSGFRWRTAVYVDDLDEATGVVKGNVYVHGHGDPTLSAENLHELAVEVAAHGVRKVQGQLVVDATYFDGDVEPPHYAEQKQESAGFRAPVAGFGVARSAVTVVVTAEPGGAAKVTLQPVAGDYVKLAKAQVGTIASGRTRIRVDAKSKKDHLELEVSGEIRAIDGSYEVRKRIDEPARFAAEVFRKALAESGVKIAKRGIGIAPVPALAKLVAAHDSAPLALVVREMNKLSDNYVAEVVLKTLGAETRLATAPATWADGVAAVRAYLAKIGIAAGTYRADNGSGLFGATEVSAHQVMTLLRAAHADYRVGPDLVASLPTGGVDGTLAKRWQGHPARGRVRAKTGTLDKVITLAGFVGVDSGHPLGFAIFVNEIPPGQRAPARAMADEMIDAMVAYLEPQAR